MPLSLGSNLDIITVMAKVTTIRSIKPKVDKSAEITVPTESVEESDKDAGVKVAKSNRVCQFCQAKTEPTYTDVQTLKRFLSDRSRIQPKNRTHLCSKHQRRATVAIKHARHLSMLPFVSSL